MKTILKNIYSASGLPTSITDDDINIIMTSLHSDFDENKIDFLLWI